MTRYVTKRVLELSPAVTQGLAAIAYKYLKYQASRVRNPWFKPMIFVPPEDGPKAGAGAEAWRCLPLTQENLPEHLRLAVAALAAAERRGGGGSGRSYGEERPADAQLLARNGSERGHAAGHPDAEADVAAVTDSRSCEASLEDTEAAALMRAAVERFLRSC